MTLVMLTALGVGGATMIGALIGFVFKKQSHKFSDMILSFAAGLMLAAAVLGLIVPSIEYGGKYGILITVIGIFLGSLKKATFIGNGRHTGEEPFNLYTINKR